MDSELEAKLTYEYVEEIPPEVDFRWSFREFNDGFKAVKDGIKSAKRCTPSVSDERRAEILAMPELNIEHWIELTGIGIGYLHSYDIGVTGVTFRKWTEEEIGKSPPNWQSAMFRDNRESPNLPVPFSPAELLRFLDADGFYFGYFVAVPDWFRQGIPAATPIVEPIAATGDVTALLLVQAAHDVLGEADKVEPPPSMPADVPRSPRTRTDGLALAMRASIVAYKAKHRADPTARAMFDWLAKHDETGNVIEFDADNDTLTWKRSDGGFADTKFKSFQGRFTKMMRK